MGGFFLLVGMLYNSYGDRLLTIKAIGSYNMNKHLLSEENDKRCTCGDCLDGSKDSCKNYQPSRIASKIGCLKRIFLTIIFGYLITLSLSLVAIIPCHVFATIFMGIMLANSEVELHTISSPDKKITALVIRDDCGATCSCNTRVDLETSSEYIEEIWRGIDVCDAEINWITPTEFYILDDNRQRTYIDTSTYILSP